MARSANFHSGCNWLNNGSAKTEEIENVSSGYRRHCLRERETSVGEQTVNE